MPISSDGWYLRDAVCPLFGWPPGSREWNSFIEYPAAQDTDRLIEHLGLEWYDPKYQPHRTELARKLDHPGFLVYAFHSVRMAHAVYEPHLRYPWGLPPQYTPFDPELYRVVVDVRQPPHPTT
jgi:hypothetical protein